MKIPKDTKYALGVLRSGLKLGDILLLNDTPDNTTFKHTLIEVGQAATSVKVTRENIGQAKMVHALIWIGDGSLDGIDVAEASGEAGQVRATFVRAGTYSVFRCMNRDLASRAVDAASNWSRHGTMAYAKRKAITSIGHSDELGRHGRARAQAYAGQIDREGPAWGGGRSFCSEFVVACYQAAAIDLGLALEDSDVLCCDAKHCSVRALHDRLLHDWLFREDGLFVHAGDLTLDLGLSVAETI